MMMLLNNFRLHNLSYVQQCHAIYIVFIVMNVSIGCCQLEAAFAQALTKPSTAHRNSIVTNKLTSVFLELSSTTPVYIYVRFSF